MKKQIVTGLVISILCISAVAIAAISPSFPSSFPVAVTGNIVKPSDINTLGDAVQNLDKRAMQIVGSQISFLKTDGTLRSSSENFSLTDTGSLGLGVAAPGVDIHVKKDTMLIESTSFGTAGHSLPQVVLRSNDQQTQDGAGGFLRFQSFNKNNVAFDAVQLNGGLVDATVGSEDGDLDLAIYRDGVVDVLALRGDFAAFMPEFSGVWSFGTPANMWKNLYLQNNDIASTEATANIARSGGVGSSNILLSTEHLGTNDRYFIRAKIHDGSYKFTLDYLGNALANSWGSISDIRKKENITPLSNALEKITNLHGVSFLWKDSKKADSGVIAQEVEKEFPEFVHTTEDGTKTVEYGKLTAPLIEAVKELKKENEQQDILIQALLQRIDVLEE